MNHYIMLLDSIELATDQRRKNVYTLQCNRCKKHFRCKDRETTKAMLYYHELNEECVESRVTAHFMAKIYGELIFFMARKMDKIIEKKNHGENYGGF